MAWQADSNLWMYFRFEYDLMCWSDDVREKNIVLSQMEQTAYYENSDDSNGFNNGEGKPFDHLNQRRPLVKNLGNPNF